MDLSVKAFLGLLAFVGVTRVVEMAISRRNQRALAARGARKIPERVFPWMVLGHAAVLAGAGLEVVTLRRPFIPPLAAAMGALFVLATALRWWVVRTLGTHWNVQVMDSGRFGVVTTGPYGFVRHPNYVAVFVELVALPLIHTAWLTALASAATQVLILARRISVEEGVLLSHAEYRATMGRKARFVPGLF
jgi:methyltransferase